VRFCAPHFDRALEGRVSKIDIYPVSRILEKETPRGSSLITILQDIQAEYGYLPREVLLFTAQRLNVPITKILGAATFYAQFRFEPKGTYVIRVCHGTACHIAGAQKITDVIKQNLGISEGETTQDMLFTLEKVACLGCCALAPVVMINENTYGKLTPNKIIKTLKEYREGRVE
jgi:NADH-quinone oxidoreductase subunit E